MNLSLAARIGDKVLKGLVRSVKEQVVAISLSILALIIYAALHKLSLQAIKDNAWETFLPWIWILCGFIFWHIGKSSVAVYKEEQQALASNCHIIVLPGQTQRPLEVPPLSFRLKLYAVALIYFLLPITCAYLVWEKANLTPEHPKATEPFTLEYLFRTDFPNLFKSSRSLTVRTFRGDASIDIPYNVYLDYLGKSEFVGFFVPHSANTYELCETLAWAPQKAIADMQDHSDMWVRDLGQETHLKDLTFTGRVFVYNFDPLSLEQIVALRSVYRSRGLSVEFRGLDYLSGEAKNPNRKR